MRSNRRELLLEDFADEFLCRLLKLLGPVAQHQEALLIHFYLEVSPLEAHFKIDRLQEFLIVGYAMGVPELGSLLLRPKLVRQGVYVLFVSAIIVSLRIISAIRNRYPPAISS